MAISYIQKYQNNMINNNNLFKKIYLNKLFRNNNTNSRDFKYFRRMCLRILYDQWN